jgi:hypothetical protein
MNTGWIPDAEPEEPAAPAMPLTSLVLGTRQHGGDVLATAMARSQAEDHKADREAAAAAVDPDERAANLIAVGVLPGRISDLARQRGDAEAELEAERAKIAEGERVNAIAMREHAAGRLGIWQVQRLLDRDFGDAQRAAVLERRIARLDSQMAEAAALMAPTRAPEDPIEAASSRARARLAEVTRARMEAAAAGRPARARRPFASGSRGGLAARSEQPGACRDCLNMGATEAEAFYIHHPELHQDTPDAAARDKTESRSKGGRTPMIYR